MKRTNYWKLGVFVVAGTALALTAVVYLSSGLLGRSSVDYQVYFDESVQGLDVGSLVRFRGVTLGQVSRIRVAPDQRHIQVTCALRTGDLRKEGLELERDRHRYLAMPPGLRAQLAVIGLTGQEIVALDYFDPNTHPVAILPFPTAERTIPSTPSLFASLGTSLGAATEELPRLLSSARQLMDEGVRLLAPLRDEDLGKQVATTLDQANAVLVRIQRIGDQLQAEQVPQNLANAVAMLGTTLSSLDTLLASVGGERGLLSGTQKAAAALVGTAQATNPLGRELAETLRNAQTTLEALRRLADTIDREPDVLIKGRARSSHP
jgi:ABC-type transporter Mla subunit MlaD